ncbi:hypothetical protein FXO38_09154 [Capsicum annuum]|uniref:CCHC-type domain-containing protein n=1 Tax=Capsicum annuum TaxID=4072 RepID=A0A2G2YWE7_CAPAN|nr:hypothetical protein FXO38_09154 [Capsicum annuum]PHT74054.1 hypothetical protein T459_21331 [Capsicum annuum]
MPRPPLNQNHPIQIDDMEGEGTYRGEKLDKVALFVEFMKNRRESYGGGHRGHGGKFGSSSHGRGNLGHHPHVQEELGDQGGNMGRDMGLNTINITLPTFKGTSDLSIYLDWELQCNWVFQLNELTPHKKVSHAIAQLKRFKKEQLIRLHNLQQGDRSVEKYHKEFQNLILHLYIVKPPIHCIARFKGGLCYEIVSQLVVHKFDQIEDLVEAVIEVERNNDAKNTFGWNKNKDAYKPFDNKPVDRAIQRYPPRLGGNTSSTPNPKGIVCFKCQGWDHKASECPNRRRIIWVEGDP